MRSGGAVQELLEARGRVPPEDQRLDRPDAPALPHGRPADLLDVDVAVVERVQIRQAPGLVVGRLLSFPDAVTPFRVLVADPQQLKAGEKCLP